MRDYFQSPGLLTRAAIGFGIFMEGAVGIETLSNFVELNSVAHSIHLLAEVGAELTAVTIILWPARELSEQTTPNRALTVLAIPTWRSRSTLREPLVVDESR